MKVNKTKNIQLGNAVRTKHKTSYKKIPKTIIYTY